MSFEQGKLGTAEPSNTDEDQQESVEADKYQIAPITDRSASPLAPL